MCTHSHYNALSHDGKFFFTQWPEIDLGVTLTFTFAEIGLKGHLHGTMGLFMTET